MADPIISIRDLHKWYSGVHALKGVSLDIHPDQTLGLVGDKVPRKTIKSGNYFKYPSVATASLAEI